MNERFAKEPREADDDRILDFVNGLLGPEDRRDVLSRAARDAAFEARLRAISASAEKVRVAQAVVSTVPSRRSGHALAGMVATVAALVFLLQPAQKAAEEAASYWIPLETDFLRSRSSSAEIGGLLEGIEAYRDQDAHRAVERLEPLELSEGFDDLRRVILASAQLQAGDPEGALRTVEGLDVTTLPQPWRDRTSWILYLSLRALGEDAQAETLLADLVTTRGDIGRRAREERYRRGS